MIKFLVWEAPFLSQTVPSCYQLPCSELPVGDNFLGHLTQITLSTSTTVSIGDDIWSNKLLCVNKIAGHAKNKPAEPVLR